ncbi:hypothetical protein VTK26DRAFT_5891 [Humicola hyalothermophila]
METKQQADDTDMEKHRKPDKPPEDGRQPKYHVYVRLPFNRGDFVDPGTVNWDEKKSEALWSILSDASIADVDWTRLAAEFDVSVDFLLQMANYLTERHTSQLRAQMMKAAAARGSNAPSPVPGAEPPGGYQGAFEAAKRLASGTGRAPSALSIRREAASPLPKNEGDHDGPGVAGPSTLSNLPSRPRTSRTSSAGTATPSQTQPVTKPGTAVRLNDPQRRRFPHLTTPSAQPQQDHQPRGEHDTENPPSSPAASTSSSQSSSSSDSVVQSRIIRRPPRFQAKSARGAAGAVGGDADDDDEDEPAFLPFKPPTASSQSPGGSSGQDLGATLRGGLRGLDQEAGGRSEAAQSLTSDSSVGSAVAIVPRRAATAGPAAGTGEKWFPAGAAAGVGQQAPVSPRRMTELAGRGQGSAMKGRGTSREGSDGTPSMGSSFSDLDDASVTQSALEEALASRMQDGTIGSRMSVIGGTIGGTIGQAIRSRYLPKSNR